MKVESYASTHIGRRNNNEDAFCADSGAGLYLVADGMGGYEGGEVASGIVVETMQRFFSASEDRGTARLDRKTFSDDEGFRLDVEETSEVQSRQEAMMTMAIRLANREVARRRVGPLAQMGSTLAALLVRDQKALVAHVGDSRIYRLRQGKLEALTIDHSVQAERMAAAQGGQKSRWWFYPPNTLTRAVGVPGLCRPDIRIEELHSGDRFLLCTDGLTDVLRDRDIRSLLLGFSAQDCVDHLVREAYRAGAQDNITAVLVQIR